jgi:hypothetical protein
LSTTGSVAVHEVPELHRGWRTAVDDLAQILVAAAQGVGERGEVTRERNDLVGQVVLRVEHSAAGVQQADRLREVGLGRRHQSVG